MKIIFNTPGGVTVGHTNGRPVRPGGPHTRASGGVGLTALREREGTGGRRISHRGCAALNFTPLNLSSSAPRTPASRWAAPDPTWHVNPLTTWAPRPP
jgi:hypothetical protein